MFPLSTVLNGSTIVAVLVGLGIVAVLLIVGSIVNAMNQ